MSDSPDHAIPTLPDDHDYEASVPTAPTFAVISTGDVIRYASKAHAQTVGVLLLAVIAALTDLNPATSMAVVIAAGGLLLSFVIGRKSEGLLAYTKLGVAILTAAAQVVVPVFFTHEWSKGLLAIVGVQVLTAFYTWLLPDGKSPLTAFDTKVK